MNVQTDIVITDPSSNQQCNEKPEKLVLKYPNFGLDLSKQKVKKGRNMIHPDLVKTPFVISCVGPRGSGKSVLIKHMLKSKNFYQGIFDYCIFLSPTLDLNDDYKEFKEDGEKIFKFSKPSEFEEVLGEILESQTDIIKSSGKKKCPEVLIVADDIIDSNLLRRSEKSVVNTISFRGRHCQISIIYAIQKLSSLPRGIRLNADMMVLFPCFNYSELESYLVEYVSKTDYKNMRNTLFEIFDTEFEFVVINNNQRRVSQKIRKMFSEVINVKSVKK